jgi:hypothetical protein
MSHHAHFVVVPVRREIARLHVPEKSIAIFREGWRVICGRSASILIRTERSGVTHEKFVNVSVFSVYYLPSDPIDASYSLILTVLRWSGRR